MNKKNTYTHLSIYDRMTIHACIVSNMSINEIATRMKRHKTTILREIKRNSEIQKSSSLYHCPSLDKCKICNNCHKKAYCRSTKIYYDYAKADTYSNNRNVESRSLTKLPKDEIRIIDDIVSNGVKKGQSLHHIYIANPILAKICSERTIRRLCYKGYLTCKAHELRRYVTYKRDYKSTKKEIYIRDPRFLLGRTYKDFLDYTKSHKTAAVVQFDSVIGKRNDKQAILTLNWKEFNFQTGILVKKGDPRSAIHEVKKLFKLFTIEEIKKLFHVCICDNGTEFSSFYELEKNTDGIDLLQTFYARPYRSTDKAECERNHEFIRYFISKGKTFDNLTQEDVNYMFSQINSCIRKSKQDRTPCELMINKYGVQAVERLGIKKINKRDIVLTLKK